MRKIRVVALPLILVSLLACGGGDSSEPSPEGSADPALTPAVAPQQPDPEAVARGAAVWEDEGCSLCHGEAGEGGEIAPPLRQLAAHWTPGALAAYLADPVVDPAENPRLAALAEQYEMEMPGVQASTGSEVTDLVTFLMSRQD
jgi:cytochrome c553